MKIIQAIKIKISQIKDNRIHSYMMLGRLQADCKYYLGWGNRNTNRLWAGTEIAQIKEMKRLYKTFPYWAKPNWCTWKDISEYEKQMC